MRRKPVLRKAAVAKRLPRRRADADALVVPAFDSGSTCIAAPAACPASEDAAEEAVRRMVEAAYT